MACSFHDRHDPSQTNSLCEGMTYYANDFDTPFYQRPHDLPATTAKDSHSVPSTMISTSLSSTALLPREIVSGILVSDGMPIRNEILYRPHYNTNIVYSINTNFILDSNRPILCWSRF